MFCSGVPVRPLVSIICLTDDIYCIGPRRISSQLKRHGFDVRLVFLQAQSLWGQISQRFRSRFLTPAFSESLYQDLINICNGSLVVGLSVWTHQADEAELLTRRLQQDLDSKIIWGGIHPTSFPDQCMNVVEGIASGKVTSVSCAWPRLCATEGITRPPRASGSAK